MWCKNFPDRLQDWADLRRRARDLQLQLALQIINDWWIQSPWRPYYLHWDDREQWPDPWQLLADNIYCDLARALGMLYTVKLLDRPDLSDAQMVGADEGNLVLIQQGKYIMNWNQQLAVNIQSTTLNIKTVLEPAVLESLTG